MTADNMRKALLIFALSAMSGAVVYLALRYAGTNDAAFFSLIMTFSVLLACLASPERNILSGIKRLWLHDWVITLLMPGIISSIGPNESVLLRLVRFICFFTFFMAAAISVRRGRTGRN